MIRTRLPNVLNSLLLSALAATAPVARAQAAGPATLEQLGGLIDSAAAALGSAREIERSLRLEADHQQMFVTSMQAHSIDPIGCSSNPADDGGSPCNGVEPYIPSTLSNADSAAYVQNLTAQLEQLDRRINEILHAIRGADYTGAPEAWSKGMRACASIQRDAAVNCLRGAWRKRPAQVDAVPRDSAPDRSH